MPSSHEEILSHYRQPEHREEPTVRMPVHLQSDCHSPWGPTADYCTTCVEPVKQSKSGKWYITIGHAGFNSRANNGSGYGSKERAVAAFHYYSKAGA